MKSDDLAQFRITYITECKELLNDMEERLLELDQDNVDNETLNAIFRCAHSIKGGAGAFGFARIAEFTHILEAVLDNMRAGKIFPSQEIVDVLLESGDILKKMIETVESGQTVATDFGSRIQEELHRIASGEGISISQSNPSGATQDLHEQSSNHFYNIGFVPGEHFFSSGNEPLLIIKELATHGKIEVEADLSKLPSFDALDTQKCYMEFKIQLETSAKTETVREAFEFVEDDCKYDISEFAGLFDNEEPEVVSSVETQPVANSETKVESTTVAEKDGETGNNSAAVVNSIRVDVEKIDKLVNLVGELVITQAMISAQTRDLPFDQFSGLLKGVEDLNHHTRELQEAVMSVRMQPVKTLFSRMPRIVRDLSKRLNKEIKLELSGETTEVDKTIIEQLSDPLTHIIRNSVDHGIETPDHRSQVGKREEGTIHLSADQRGGKIVIEIKDDGAGINREKVLAKAIEREVVTKEAAAMLSPEQIDRLVFEAGFSTAEMVSDISGRGVGMDVVRRNIESIGGFIEMQNNPGMGLTIQIYIPLTLAILDGMIVGVGDENYIIPISNIVETLRPSPDEIKKIADSNDLISIRGEFIQVLYLGDLFNVADYQKDPSEALVVVVETNNSKFGLVVDELIGQQQVVIKSLDENSVAIEGVSGATILGDGRVSLILDMTKLMHIGIDVQAIRRAA